MDVQKDTSIIEKEENMFDSISEINVNNLSAYRKNTSFYSQDETITESLKLSKKADIEAVKMLPLYIDKVQQNIKLLEAMINGGKAERESSKSHKNTPTKENISNISHKNFINAKPAIKEFAVIEERDEEMLCKTSVRVPIKSKIVKPIAKKIENKIKPVKKSIVSTSVSINTTIDVKKLKNSGESVRVKSLKTSANNTPLETNSSIKSTKKANGAITNYLKLSKDNSRIKPTHAKKPSTVPSIIAKPNKTSITFTEKNQNNKRFIYAKSTPILNAKKDKCCQCNCKVAELKHQELKSSIELFYIINDYIMSNATSDSYGFNSMLRTMRGFIDTEDDFAKMNFSETSILVK